MWPGPLPNFVRDDANALQRIRRDRRLEAARRGEQCVQLTILDSDGSASTSASPPPRNLDRAYDPEESTIIHDVLGSSLPNYAILAASRAAAQAIADHNAAERRALLSPTTVDGPTDLLTPASFSNVDECVDVDPLFVAVEPPSLASFSIVDECANECVSAGPLTIAVAPSLNAAPAAPLQLDKDVVYIKQLVDKFVHIGYLLCIGMVVALFAAYNAATKLLALELLRRA